MEAEMRAPDESPFAASTGQTATRADWLDLHFESALPEYTQAVKMVGLERGWHLLDAGCGAGSFLPLLAPEVGPDGRITALDFAPENIEVVRSKLASSPLECPIEALVGSLDSLPFPDDTFDAAWIANVLMYFEDEDLPGVIAELERVVRPGGLVAAKESDGRMMTVGPVPLELLRELSPLTPLPHESRGFIAHEKTSIGSEMLAWTTSGRRRSCRNATALSADQTIDTWLNRSSRCLAYGLALTAH